MSFNFPNSPTPGQSYTPVGGYQYVWDGTAWRVLEAPQLFATAQSRNRIVNGAMQISQENGDTASSSTGFYPADQWKADWYQIPTAAVGRGATVETSSGRRIGVSVSTGRTLTADDYLILGQVIEGSRIADFKWGTANAKQVVVKFVASATIAGAYTFLLRNSGATRSFLASFTLPALTWTPVTIVIPGDTTGTWPTDTGVGATMYFVVASGSTYTGVAGWNAGNKMGLPGQVNGVATASSGFNVGDVGLYLDPDATGRAPQWQMPDEAEELAACQRYYVNAPTAAATFLYGNPRMANDVYRTTHIHLPTKMRTAPAATVLGKVSGGSTITLTVDGTHPRGMSVAHNAVTAAADLLITTWSASARM